MSRIEQINDFMEGCAGIEYIGNLYEYGGVAHAGDPDYSYSPFAYGDEVEISGFLTEDKIILSNVNNGDCLLVTYNNLIKNRKFEVIY